MACVVVATAWALPTQSSDRPSDRPAPRGESIASPDDALRRARDAYRAQPVMERVTVAHTSGGVTRRATVTLRLLAPSPASPRRALLALDRLRVAIIGDELIAAADRPGGPVWRETLRAGEPAADLGALPGVPFPQVAWALDEAFDPALLPRPIGRVRWARVTTPDRAAVGVEGEGESGSVSITLDARTMRLRSLRASIRGGEIALAIYPREADNPAAWGIDAAGRAPAASPAELLAGVAHRSPAAPARKLGPVSLVTGDLAPWSIRDALKRPDQPGASPRPTPIVFVRVNGAGEPGEQGERDARAVLAALDAPADAGRPRDLSEPIVVGVFGAEALDPEKLAANAASWGARTRDAGGALPGIVFCSSGWGVVEAICPAARVALVIVDGDLTVRASSAFDDLATEGDVVRALVDDLAAHAARATVPIQP